MDAVWRLRQLQAALEAPGAPSALLFVAGVDGRDNWGSSAVLRWLVLGESGREPSLRRLLEQSPQPFTGVGDEGEAEALEETVLVVRARSAAVFYDPRAEWLLAPLLDAPGVTEYSYPVTTAVDDVDEAEAAKVEAFVAMARSWLSKAEVGVVLPRGSVDAAEEVEYWPLVQASAAGTAARNQGFFTMRHALVDATSLVSAVLVGRDAVALRSALARATRGLRRHVDETWHAMCSTSIKARADLSDAEVADRLVSFYNYGRDDDDDEDEEEGKRGEAAVNGAFALVGLASGALVGEPSDVKCTTATSTLVVFQAEDPSSGVRVCRTYFLATGAGNEALAREVDEAERAYAALIDLLHAKVPDLIATGGDLSSLSSGSTMEVYVEADLKKKKKNGDLVYVRLAARLAGGGAVAVGDTFLAGCCRGASYLVQGYGGLATGELAAPYRRTMCRAVGVEAHEAHELVRHLRDPHLIRAHEVALGHRVDAFSAATVLLVPDASNAAIDRRAVTGHLEVYAHGFALLDSGCAPLILSLARGDARRIAVRERNGQALFILEHLAPQALSRAGPVRAAAATSKLAVLVVQANSEAHRSIQDLLPKWRTDARIARDDDDDDDARKNEEDTPVTCVEAAFDQLWAGQNDLLHDVLPARAPSRAVDGMLAAWRGASERALAARMGPEKKRAGSSSADDDDDDDDGKVCALLGLPGSGVAELAASVAQRGAEDDGWTWRLVEAVVDDVLHVDVDRTALRLRQARDNGAVKKKERILVSACCVDGGARVARAISEGLGVDYCGMGVAVSTAQLLANKDGVGASPLLRWPLGLMNQCAQGYVTVLCVVDGGADAIVPLQRKLRRRADALGARHAVQVARCGRGSREISSVVDALLRPDKRALRSERDPLDHGRWIDVTLPARAVVRIPLPFVLELSLLRRALGTVLGPRAKVIERFSLADATRDAALQQHRHEENLDIQPLKALYSHARRKVERKRDAEHRLREWPARFGEWKARHAAFVARLEAVHVVVTALFGAFEVQDKGAKASVAIDVNHAVGALVNDTTKQQQPHLTLLADDPEGLDAAALGALVALAATSNSHHRTRRTRDSVTAAELVTIADLAARRDTPLPPGYAFDGRNFVDSFGNATRHRPDMDTLIADWLAQQNDAIGETNRAVHSGC